MRGLSQDHKQASLRVPSAHLSMVHGGYRHPHADMQHKLACNDVLFVQTGRLVKFSKIPQGCSVCCRGRRLT